MTISTQELIERIAASKAAIDRGFTRIGPKLDKAKDADGRLLVGANQVIRLANAAVLLCKSDEANEATALLPELEKALGRMAAKNAAGDGRLSSAIEKALKMFRQASGGAIPWAHVFPALTQPGVGPEEVLGLVLDAMDRALAALDSHWPGSFKRGGP